MRPYCVLEYGEEDPFGVRQWPSIHTHTHTNTHTHNNNFNMRESNKSDVFVSKMSKIKMKMFKLFLSTLFAKNFRASPGLIRTVEIIFFQWGQYSNGANMLYFKIKELHFWNQPKLGFLVIQNPHYQIA